jgi:hypothetical protein
MASKKETRLVRPLKCGEYSDVLNVNALRTFKILNIGLTNLIQFRCFYTNWLINKAQVCHPIFGTLVRDLNFGPWAGEKIFMYVVKIKLNYGGYF